MNEQETKNAQALSDKAAALCTEAFQEMGVAFAELRENHPELFALAEIERPKQEADAEQAPAAV